MTATLPKCTIVVLLFLLPALLPAQQTPYTMFYRSNWQFVNPAAIDRSHYLSKNHNELVLSAGFRQQWIGLEGAPQLYFTSMEYCPEIRNSQPGQKFGITAYGDRTDAISNYGFSANYSYYFILPNTRGHVLHLGISGGAMLYQVNAGKLRARDAADPVILNQGSVTYVDFALGAVYRVRRKFYLGLSMPQTLTLNTSSRDEDGVLSTERVRHVNLHVGGFIQRGRYDYGSSIPDEYTVVVEPSLLLRYVPGLSYSTLVRNLPVSADANLRVHYRHRFWLGAGYGTNGIANVEFGIGRATENDTKWQVGLGYGIPVGRRYLSLGHSVELTLGHYFY